MKQTSYLLAALALLLTLVVSACATSTAPTESPSATKTEATTAPSSPTTAKPGAKADDQTPKYGGTLRLTLTQDVANFDDAWQGGPSSRVWVQGQELWGGDWTKGPAGGFGTNETDWATTSYDIFEHKTGRLAESWKVDVDSTPGMGIVTYKIRPGVRYAINPASEVSKMVGGREVTADDVVTSLQQSTTDTRGYLFRGNPELRTAEISKTGPMEVTVKVPLSNLVTALSRMGDMVRIYPKEIREQNISMTNWKEQVGTGAFILADYVTASSIKMVKNPNYWGKDPIGPGKGNQLPYVDAIEYNIIGDNATRLAAFRTGKIDKIEALAWEESDQLKKELPQMPSGEGNYTGGAVMYIRTDKPPYNDIRVRRALMMATDFNAIKRDINGGRGIIINFPYEYYKEYKDLYVNVDDPDLSESIKEQFVYNPEKAKKLLAEAGYPNGFDSKIMTVAADVSYFEMIAGMWSKIGVNLAIDVKDPGTRLNLLNTLAYDHLTTGGKGPVSIYYVGMTISGAFGFTNPSIIKDPVIEEALPKIRLAASTDTKAAMKMARENAKHVLEQAYVIQSPSYRAINFWWPWLKNHSGEVSVGYFNAGNWAQYAWLDQDMKKSMGY